MPCWEKRSQTVDMTVANLDVLAAAIKALGGEASQSEGILSGRLGFTSLLWRDGQMTIRGASEAANADAQRRIVKSYTTEAFRVAAKRAGFTVETSQQQRLVATRRAY